MFTLKILTSATLSLKFYQLNYNKYCTSLKTYLLQEIIVSSLLCIKFKCCIIVLLTANVRLLDVDWIINKMDKHNFFATEKKGET